MRAAGGARVLLAAGLLFLAVASGAAAQTSSPPSGFPHDLGFLTRYDFHLNAALLASGDRRFGWDADFGGDVDLLDYRKGRVNILGNYEAILGNELRRFDPNQGNYVIELSGSRRFVMGEVAGVFQHTSRHLSDRAKRFGIDWNMVGVHFERRRSVGPWSVKADGRLLGVIKKSFVDYQWEGRAGLSGRYPMRPRVTAIAGGSLVLIGVDSERLNRGTQAGGYIEGGVRLGGEEGALELFIAAERRIDADPIEQQPASWAVFGFRLVRH